MHGKLATIQPPQEDTMAVMHHEWFEKRKLLAWATTETGQAVIFMDGYAQRHAIKQT